MADGHNDILAMTTTTRDTRCEATIEARTCRANRDDISYQLLLSHIAQLLCQYAAQNFLVSSKSLNGRTHCPLPLCMLLIDLSVPSALFFAIDLEDISTSIPDQIDNSRQWQAHTLSN